MHRRWILVATLSLAAAPGLTAQERPDTVRVPIAPPFAPATTASDTTRLRLGLKSVPVTLPISLPSLAPGAVPVWPRLGLAGRRSAAWSSAMRDSLAARRARLWLAYRPGRRDAGADTVAYLPPVETETESPADTTSVLPGVAAEYADIGIAVEGRAEMGGVWTEFRPCDPTVVIDCDPGLFPQIRPDVEFGVRVGGTIADRVHVDVDYDQRREFDAANNINVYYQGLEDEILQRVEVGDVSISLPSSQYLTEGVPAGNFGFKAAGQLGPMEFQTVWAQQKGDVATREFRLNGGADQGLVQELEVDLDDADYVKGQFFFLAHPDSIAGSPYIDVLRLGPGDAADAVRPEGGRIEVYRTEAVDPQNLSLGHFLGHALSADGSVTHSGQFRRLTPGEDYSVHRSGLWLALRTPLQQDQILAVSYVTAAGDTVGTLDADRRDDDVGTPTLRLLRGPVTDHDPGRPTWPFEMHQVYRLDASNDVEPASIELEISLGRASAGVTYRDVAGEAIPFLQLFGLDEDSPTDRIDAAQIHQPAREGLSESAGGGGAAGVGGTYIVFPTLEPFAHPPPGQRAGLTAEQVEAALGSDANAAIYEAEDPIERNSAARFRLNFRYRVRTEGLVSSFNLGAFGIRDDSERIYVDDQMLERGTDYTIDYELGQVTLLEPQRLFAGRPDAEIRAAYEQQALFRVSPRSVFGAHTHWDLAEHGRFDLVGLYQSEKAFINRPQLGIEPGAVFLGGANGRLDFGTGWLDRALEAVPGLRAGDGSAVGLEGEFAFSLPNPNTRGATYLDDFEATDQTRVSLARNAWRLGAAPSSRAGASDVLPAAVDATDAASIVWQEKYRSAGDIIGAVHPRSIDEQVRVAGRSPSEPVLYLTFGDSTDTGQEHRWRSLTTVLSTTGRDLSRAEYIEFYARAGDEDDLALVLDVGSVGEDAFYMSPEGAVRGEYRDGEPWGIGELDEEARLADRELWGPERDARGLWNQRCTGHPVRVYDLGDPAANCTVENGYADTEDLDGDGVLDNGGADGAHFRYVVSLDDASPYLVRDRGETGTQYRLYRIPLRGPDAISVNGASDATMRFIRHLRLTVAGRPTGESNLFLSRVRIVGSRWTKRDVHGVMPGRTERGSGTSAQSAGFRVSPVSHLTDGAGYVSPPGVLAEPQDPTAELTVGGREFNEQALRLRYTDLAPDERAEAYHRFAQDARNLLSYRTLRMWALARDGNWGEQGDQWLLVKVGTDAGNAYLYQTRLAPAAGDGVSQDDWRELIIDFERWFELRLRAEERIVNRDAGDVSSDGVTIWDQDSTYAVVLQDRAQAPNLAAVREVSFAVYNAAGASSDGEVWIDDMTLTEGVTDPGLAGRVDLDMAAGEFVDANVSYSTRSPLFRQLNRDASYLGTEALNVSGTARLGRLLPAGWGVGMPVTVAHTRMGETPMFLRQSDLRADRMEDVRETGQTSTRVGIAIARETPTANPLLGLLLDGSSLRMGYRTSDRGAITSRSTSEGFDGTLAYSRRLVPRSFDLTPGPLEAVLRWLTPAALEETDAFERLFDARLRWTPVSVSVSTAYVHQESRAYRYDNILRTDADADRSPFVSPREALENTARISLQPLESLTADLSVTSDRDVLAPAAATDDPAQRAAVRRARSEVGGIDIGWETNRIVDAQVGFRPEITDWLRPAITYDSRFDTGRNPSDIEARPLADDDTVYALRRTMRADRRLTRSLMLDPAGMARSAFGPSEPESGFVRALRSLAGLIAPIDVSWTTGLGSRWERQAVDPSVAYQLGVADRDGFRHMDGDTAFDVLTRRSLQARTGIRTPWQLVIDVAYSTRDASAENLRGGGRVEHERSWPDLRVGWSSVPLPGFLRSIIGPLSLSSGIVRTLREGTIGAGADHDAVEYTVPLQLGLGLAGSASLSYNGSLTRGTTSDPTGDAEHDAIDHSVGVSAGFRAPGPLREAFEQPIQASLSYRYGTQRQCRFELDRDDCVPFVDNVNRQLDLILDTMMSDLNVGLQVAHIDRQSHVGTRPGSSNFQLRLFGNFNFSAGTFGGGQ